MKKYIGYLISAIGLLGLVLTVESIKTAINFPLPEGLADNTLMIISAVLIIIGIFFIYKTGGGSKKEKEVPIYKGKEVVGYRQV